MPARGRLLAWTIVALFVVGGGTAAVGEDCPQGEGSSLAELGALALEGLPGDYKIVKANLSAHRPVAVVACYLMRNDLLVVSQTGMVYCMSRRDLTPRWVASLKAPLAAIPAEGPNHFTFLVKEANGTYMLQAVSKRTGAEADHFPVRLPFAASCGVANDESRVFVGSLGSPRDNKTVESFSLVNGRMGWGWRTRGLVWATPVLDPSGNSLIVAGEDGTVVSLPVGGTAPSSPNWAKPMTGAVMATPAVTSEHVVVGSVDGLLRCLDLGSGSVNWLEGLDAPIKVSPWVIGRVTVESRASGVDGAPDVEVDTFTGLAFARTRNGLYALDLVSGKRLFHDGGAVKPLCQTGKFVLTVDGERTVTLRDMSAECAVTGTISLKMFHLLPTNTTDGAIYGCTADGGIVAAVPGP